MTAELNSHQRVSYYTGVKLIRHHQNQSNSNTSSANNTSTVPTNTGAGVNSSTNTGGYFPPHSHHQYPLHGPALHHQHSLPPLPHPGHFHLQCPTGPPHIQHPGGIHLSNHHGPPHHPHHHNNNNHGNQHGFGLGGGCGPNHATRLYAGSPLIRSSTFQSINGNPGNQKRSFKHHHNRGHHISYNSHYHNGNKYGGGAINQSHHHHHPNSIIVGGSCSSGTSSSSSSSEHLNTFQSPTGSPTGTAKLDISPLKLASSSQSNGDSSTSSGSNNSSPGPEGSPSPSASSASPSSSDGNKDLDHFYFLDEHWKPTSEGTNVVCGSNIVGESSAPGDVLDNMTSSTSSVMSLPWASSSSGSPSPPASTAASATLTMMVDKFFASRDNNQSFSNLVDANNNVVGGGPSVVFNEMGRNPHLRGDQDLFHSFSTSGIINNGGSCTGASGLFKFGGPNNKTGGGIINKRSESGSAATVVNVETQIGTFNGQRDLEIRLCFIKGDHNQKEPRTAATNTGDKYMEHSAQENLYISPQTLSGNGEASDNVASIIGDPFCRSNMKNKIKDPAATSPETDNFSSVKGSSSNTIISSTPSEFD